ncbi:MAG: CRISPR-associated endonuclease Cas1 [Actinomycetales bacterium]|nr:CRISPR-associated endonuclease Cas1 [Actinomycetales bacterium]
MPQALDPALGLLHSDQDNRPSLALDLQEEFRALIVDQVVAEAIRQRRLRPEHGRTEQGRSGVFLTKAGQTLLLDAYERRMLHRAKGALPDFAGTWRRHLYRQAQRLRAAIMDPTVSFTGLTWRP